MAEDNDSKTIIEVELRGDTDKLKADLKEVSAYAKTLNADLAKQQRSHAKANETISNRANKHARDQLKNTKKQSKEEKGILDNAKKYIKSIKDKLKTENEAYVKHAAFSKRVGVFKNADDNMPGTPPPSGGGGGRRRKRGKRRPPPPPKRDSRGKRFAKGVGGLAATGVASALAFLTGGATEAYSDASEVALKERELLGLGISRKNMESAYKAAPLYGYNQSETISQASALARATGSASSLTQAQMMSRASGMDMEGTIGMMGAMTSAGRGFGGKAGTRGKEDIVKIFSEAVKSGIDKSRFPEYFEGVQKLIQRQAENSAGDVSGVGSAQLLAFLGSSKKSGLQGSRGSAVLDKLDQAIRSPGGGDAGQTLMLQALGWGKPGGSASYYEAKKQQQKGVTDPKNLANMFSEVFKQYGGVGEKSYMALGELTGLPYDIVEALSDIISKSSTLKASGTLSKGEQDEMKKLMDSTKSIEEQTLDEIKKFGNEIKRVATLQEESRDVGKEIKPTLDEIKNFFHDIFITVMKDLIKIMRELKDSIDFIRFGGSNQAVDTNTLKTNILKEMTEADKSLASGGMSKEEYRNKLVSDIEKLQTRTAKHTQSLMENNDGFSFGKMASGLLKSAGYDIQTDSEIINGADSLRMQLEGKLKEIEKDLGTGPMSSLSSLNNPYADKLPSWVSEAMNSNTTTDNKSNAVKLSDPIVIGLGQATASMLTLAREIRANNSNVTGKRHSESPQATSR